MSKKKKTPKLPQVLLFTDINIYPDDLGALVVLSWLHKNKLINLRGVITEMGDYLTRRRRALYAKGALGALNMPFIRVVPGGDYEPVPPEHNVYRQTLNSDFFEHNGAAILRSGNLFIQEFFKSVKDKEIVVLLNAPFPDFAHFMKMTPDVVKKKVKKIVAFGAALPHTEGEPYKPDTNCFNFKNCPEAPEILFKTVQEKNIKLVLACKENLKEIAADSSFLDAVKNSKNPVLQELLSLRKEEKESMLYDMFSALAVADKTFWEAGGAFEKDEGVETPLTFAKVQDKELLKNKFIEIFKEMFEIKKISLDQLKRRTEEKTDEPVA